MSLVRERIDAVEVIRLDRPERRNAMDSALLGALVAALDELAADEQLRALVISTTSEGALSAGVDVGEDLDAAGGVARMQAITCLFAAIEAFPAPALAVCVGHCVGAGAELAAGCDLRVGGDNAALAWAGARHGVPVGPARLAPLIGISRAKDWVLTGRVVGAEEALAAGFLHDVVPAAQAEARALELAEALGDVRALKAMFGDLDGTAARVDYENALLTEFQRAGAGLPKGRE